ncbi:hypothetical protein PIB30_043304 [Stylosanthes scabra]|uniref:Secreted protein n=1 Tax=Stylosanthes scabra TaxID=79078 RepID=A0ABU6ZE88_9FABA|nr:hypothetical protein [Stylosanthes scabra]
MLRAKLLRLFTLEPILTQARNAISSSCRTREGKGVRTIGSQQGDLSGKTNRNSILSSNFYRLSRSRISSSAP